MNTIKLTTAAAVITFTPRFEALNALDELDALEHAALKRNEKAIQACAQTMAWIRGERNKEPRTKGLISLAKAIAARRSAQTDLEGAMPAIQAAMDDLRGRLAA